MSATDEGLEPHQNPANNGKIGLRFNQGKLPMELIPVCWITGLAKVMQYGAKKYAVRNWENPTRYSIIYGCAMRHLLAFWEGGMNDPESKLHHLLHAAWNCLALYFYDYLGRYKGMDDRPDHYTPVVDRTEPCPSICPVCMGEGRIGGCACVKCDGTGSL